MLKGLLCGVSSDSPGSIPHYYLLVFREPGPYLIMEHQVWITFMIMVILVRHMSSAAESSTQTWATMNGPAWVDGTEFLGRYTISGESMSPYKDPLCVITDLPSRECLL